MSLTKNQFGSVNNPFRTITHSLRKSACCKLLSVLQLKTLVNNKTINSTNIKYITETTFISVHAKQKITT